MADIYGVECTVITKSVTGTSVSIDAIADLTNSTHFLILGGHVTDVDGNRHFFNCLELKAWYRRLSSDAAKLANIQHVMEFVAWLAIDDSLLLGPQASLDIYELAGFTTSQMAQPDQATLFVVGLR